MQQHTGSDSDSTKNPIFDPLAIDQPTPPYDLSKSSSEVSAEFDRQVLDILPTGIVVQTLDGRIDYCNASTERILGLTAEQMRDRTSVDPRWQAIHEDGSPFPGETHPAIISLKTGQPCFNVVMGVRKPDNSLCWILINSVPLFNPLDTLQPIAAVSSFTDITSNKQVAEKVSLEKERFANLFNATPIAQIVTRFNDGVCVSVNPRFSEVFGYSAEEIVGHTSEEIPFFQPADRVAWIKQLREEGAIFGKELPLLNKQGNTVWVLASARTLKLDHETYVVSIFKDITERKHLELALQRSEEQYRNLARNLPGVSVLLFDHDLRYVLAEGKDLHKNGFTREQVEGRTIWEVLPPEACERLMPYYQAALGGIEHTFENEYNDKLYLVQATPVTNEQGEISGGMFITQDITLLRQLEEQVITEKERLSVTLRSIGDGVISTDLSGRITLLNRVAEKLTGWKEQEAVGQPIEQVFQLIHSKTGEPISNPIHETLEINQTTLLAAQAVLVSRDGTKYNVADSCAPIYNSRNQVVGAVMVFHDNTQQLRLNESLLIASKLESLGILAGGIAHDFNNLLMGIIGNVELAKLIGDSDSIEVSSLLDDAVKAAMRSKEITGQLLTFAKGGTPIKKIAHLAQIVQESVNFALHGTNVRAQFERLEDLWTVEVDLSQINQVIQNLTINAVQAMPRGGELTIIGENLRVASGKLLNLPAGRYICLSVQDNGIGIAPEELNKVFDPYYTTKSSGNGLGLAVCYSVIRQHSGIITVESQQGKGTTFRIYLPASFQTVVKENGQQEPKLIMGSGRILVMDDEEPLRRMAQRTISRFGYEVETATDGKEALELYKEAQTQGRPFRLVLLDLTVPGGVGGAQTLEELRQIDPKVKAIVCSGYSNSPIIANYTNYGFVGRLIKPYNLEDLSKILYQFSAASE